MKTKKLFLPIIILIVALTAMTVFAIITNIAKRPTITEQNFPFSITYTLNGETVTIEDVYTARFVGNGGYVDTTERQYTGNIVGLGEDGGASYILRDDVTGSIYLHANFYADYMMGDPLYDYFSSAVFEPTLVYYDTEYNEYTDAQTLCEQGVILVHWEYPEPIVNPLVFSHIAPLSSMCVLPMVLIAVLALLVVIIFVKKEKDLLKKPLDVISIVLNFLIALIFIPFTIVYGIFSDINGSSPELLHQLGYLIPAIGLLGLAASISLRRKGFPKSSFAVQFAGPAIFALLVICLVISEYL